MPFLKKKKEKKENKFLLLSFKLNQIISVSLTWSCQGESLNLEGLKKLRQDSKYSIDIIVLVSQKLKFCLCIGFTFWGWQELVANRLIHVYRDSKINENFILPQNLNSKFVGLSNKFIGVEINVNLLSLSFPSLRLM